jgi:hypothetical protein
MRYLLFIGRDKRIAIGPDDRIGDGTEAWVNEMDGRHVRLEGHELAGIEDATTVRVRDDEVLITDGPFAETKELIAGFDIIECADLDEAIEVASKHPMARFGFVEVRPFSQG